MIMGERLVKYYSYVNTEKGLTGKIALAQETKISSVVAATAPDDAKNISTFIKAVEKITGKRAPAY